ncbi:MAG: TonB family protein [Candidatus Eremiobacteraeota bacterium]|nr:TonB family protein [Candidatus Eremiobacteraeota bacterium]MBV8373638.1 TonB family protein [Candidatus Eremiobacteraeota bacterium]
MADAPKPSAPKPAPKKRESRYITTSERVSSFIGIAIILSLIIHLAVGAFLPNLANQHESNEVEKVSMTKKIRVRVPTPPPKPTPTPPPTPTPNPQTTPPPKKAVEQPKPLKVNLVHTTSNTAGGNTENTVSQPKTGSENGAPGGTGNAASAAPAATAKPACANPNVEATVTNPVQPDYPESAKDLGLGAVSVEVKVTVGPSGNLVGAEVYKSSNNMSIDQAALRAARQSTYSPKLINCSPTTGDYLFRADFQPDS